MMEEGYYQIPAYGNHEENIKEDKSFTATNLKSLIS